MVGEVTAKKLTMAEALGLARTLTTIHEFPRFDEAITATALDLLDWCQGETVSGTEWTPREQAQWLVQEARLNWAKWTGTADLRALFRSKFPTKVEAGNAYRALGVKPTAQCSQCNDMGTVRLPDGWSEWCRCNYAEQLRRGTPGWLDLVNSHLPPKPGVVRTAGPALDVGAAEEEFRQYQLRAQAALEIARATLKNPGATLDKKAAAKETLRLYLHPPKKTMAK